MRSITSTRRYILFLMFITIIQTCLGTDESHLTRQSITDEIAIDSDLAANGNSNNQETLSYTNVADYIIESSQDELYETFNDAGTSNHIINSDIVGISDDIDVSNFSDNSDSNNSQEHITIEIPPIFVVNLDRATTRWSNIQKVMKQADLKVERLAGVDGRRLSVEELQNLSTKMGTFFQPRGVIGCYLSHRKFWQYVVDRNYSSAIIFEDDVALIPNFKSTLQYSLTRLNQDQIEFDILFLGAIGMVNPDGREGVFSRLFSAYMGGARSFLHINDYLYQPSRPAGTHAYMVSQAGAQRLLTLCTKATFHVDLDAFRHQSLIIYMFKPMMAFQTFEDSSLTDLSPKQGLLGVWKRSPLYKNLESWASDKYTHQTFTHVMEEPLLQLGPRGPVITVERHLQIASLLTAASVLARYVLKFKRASSLLMGVTAAFTVWVRATIHLLMNWK